MKGELLFLGTGGSSGIPMIGCDCSVCLSKNPFNQRLRPSALVTIENKKILIDAGPDIRTQALRYHVNHLDGVLLTHTHFDHIGGLDELRCYYLKTRRTLPLLASKETLLDLKTRYPYLFREKSWGKSLSAQFEFHELEAERGSFDFIGIKIDYTSYIQGDMSVNGYRFGDLAYISDIRRYPDTLFEDLVGVRFLILSALRESPSPMHFTLEEGIEFGKKIGAESVFFTHIAHDLEHESASRLLPQGFCLAYDGLRIEFLYDNR
jgi:phosphoribosyl 1,2-cyclic phosphate phosphodiesterase